MGGRGGRRGWRVLIRTKGLTLLFSRFMYFVVRDLHNIGPKGGGTEYVLVNIVQTTQKINTEEDRQCVILLIFKN